MKLFPFRKSRTPPPRLSECKLVMTSTAVETAEERKVSMQASSGSSKQCETKEDATAVSIAELQPSQVQVQVQTATPTHTAHPPSTTERVMRGSRADSTSTDNRRGSLDPQDARKGVERFSSVCSTDSNEFHTPCGSFTEEDIKKIEQQVAEKDSLDEPQMSNKAAMERRESDKNSLDYSNKPKPEEKKEQRPPNRVQDTQRKDADPCRNCQALRKQISRSEDEIRKLTRQLSNRNSQAEIQVNKLQEELFQQEVKQRVTIEEYCRYARQLELEVYQLKARVERAEVEKQDALRCAQSLLHMAQSCSSQLPPCGPQHIHLYTPTMQFQDHAYNQRNYTFTTPTQMTEGGRAVFPQGVAGQGGVVLQNLGQEFQDFGLVDNPSEKWEEGGQGEGPSHTHSTQQSGDTIHISQSSEFV